MIEISNLDALESAADELEGEIAQAVSDLIAAERQDGDQGSADEVRSRLTDVVQRVQAALATLPLYKLDAR